MLLALPLLHGIFLSLSMGKTVTEILWIVGTFNTTTIEWDILNLLIEWTVTDYWLSLVEAFTVRVELLG